MVRLRQGNSRRNEMKSPAKLQLTNSDKVAIVDGWNSARLKKFNWRLVGNGQGSVCRTVKRNGVTFYISLACEIMHVSQVRFDHKDRNPLNNVESNLRPATVSQNGANRTKQKGCSSKYKGVSWHKHYRKWETQIKMNSKPIWIGRFASEKTAALAYDKKARELFGEFAATNFD